MPRMLPVWYVVIYMLLYMHEFIKDGATSYPAQYAFNASNNTTGNATFLEKWETGNKAELHVEGGSGFKPVVKASEIKEIVSRLIEQKAAEKSIQDITDKCTKKIEEILADHSINAGFLGNHDTTRPANFLDRRDLPRIKMGGALLAMLPGNPFVYYGEEIGMIGTGDDPNKRIGMLWTPEGPETRDPPGTTESGYVLPRVEEQLKDENSLLNWYKDLMWLRHAYPEIARGETEVLPCDNVDLCILRRSWGDSTVTIVVNPSLRDHVLSVEGELAEAMNAKGLEVKLTGGELTLPSYSIAILK